MEWLTFSSRRTHAFVPDAIHNVFVCVMRVLACAQPEHGGTGNALLRVGPRAHHLCSNRLFCRKGQVRIAACAYVCV